MELKTTGIWISAASIAVTGVTIGAATLLESAANQPLIVPCIFLLLFATAVSILGTGLASSPRLWRGEDGEVPITFIKAATGAALIVAFLTLLVGSALLFPVLSSALAVS